MQPRAQIAAMKAEWLDDLLSLAPDALRDWHGSLTRTEARALAFEHVVKSRPPKNVWMRSL